MRKNIDRKKQKALAGTALLVILATLSQILFLFGWIKMDSVQDCIWITAEKSSNCITVGDVHRIEQENALSEDKTAFVAWQEREEEVFVDELQKSVDTTVIFTSKRADILFPDARAFEESVSARCQISKRLARELFGSDDIQGLKVHCLEEEYEIIGVLEKSEPLLICFPGYDTSFDFSEITIWNPDRESSKLQVERFEERTGLQMRHQDFSFLMVIFEAVFILLIGWVFLWMARRIIRDWHGMDWCCLTAVFLVLLGIYVGLHFHGVYPDILPTRMSDEDFWRQLITEQKYNFQYLYRMKKTCPVLAWFFGKDLAAGGLVVLAFSWKFLCHRMAITRKGI